MATDIIYADTSDGRISSSDGSIAAIRAGSSLAADTTGNLIMEAYQGTTHLDAYESFLSFTTSGVGTDTVSAAVLSLDGRSTGSTNAFILEAHLYDWGTSVTTADWRTNTDLGGLTLVAHVPSGGFSTSYAYVDFTDDAFPANINKTGSTRIVVAPAAMRTNPWPGTNTTWNITAYSADASGTTTDPKLTVTHAPSGPPPRSQAVVIV